MFWRLSFRRPSAIDTILDKEDCTLGEILDEDDVLQECKSHNKKLIDFLVRPDILEELVKLVAEEPKQGVEDKVKFKYPHIACELLTSEVFTITEQLSASESLLGLLWSFLNSDTPLNPLIGSFISKVLAMLLNKEPSVIFSYMKNFENFLSKFLVHLGTSAIMDLLLQMVAVGEAEQTRQDIAMWLKEQGLVEKLVDFIGKETSTEYCANASQALCDMFILSRESYQKANPAPLLETLESGKTMQRLLDNMFSAETPQDIVIVNGISVLLTALDRRPLALITPPAEQTFNMSNPEDDPEHPLNKKDLSPELEHCLHSRLTDFHNLLQRRPQNYTDSTMHTTAGELDPPLGNTRLQVVRLFAAVLYCGSSLISSALIQLSTFSSLLGLFFQYPWNNFLHKEIEACVGAALNSSQPPTVYQTTKPPDEQAAEETSTPESTTNPKSLRHHLLTDCKLVCKILDGFDQNERVISEVKGCRLGYMGHLIRMTNCLVQSGEGDESLREALKSSLNEDTQQRWDNFILGPISELNRRNETNLGGNAPMSSSLDDSDEEFDQLQSGSMDSELEKAYQQYQDVKYVSPFMDDCGNEDELNPNEEPFEASFSRLMDIGSHIEADEEAPKSPGYFEAACESRIQQFDDSEGESEDEDTSTWTDKEVSFTSPLDRNSGSSDEDESFTGRREFQTGSSDDEESPGKRAAMYVTSAPITQIPTASNGESDKMEIDNSQAGLISWHSEVSTDAELSGDTSGISWVTEPNLGGRKPDQPESPNWADFSKAFPSTEQGGSPQERDQVSSHITVTYKSHDQGASPTTDDDIIESPEHRPNKPTTYMLLSPENSGETLATPSDVDTVQVDVDSSSDEDMHSSSDEEERSGKYNPNTSSSSEAEALVPKEDENTSSETSTDKPTPLPPNGEAVDQTSLECNSEGDRPVDELQDNFSFLSKQGMLSANTSTNNNSGAVDEEETESALLEQTRAEARVALEQWQQVTSQTKGDET